MATTASGVTVMGTDPSTVPLVPLQDHFNNLGASLDGKIIVYVANATARSALVTALAAAGYTVDASHPLVVYRADAPSYARLETYDGTTWRGLVQGDSGWLNPTFGGTWDNSSTLQYRKVGGEVELIGLAQPDSGSIAQSTTTGVIATLPAGNRPPRTVEIPIVQWVNGGTPAKRCDAVGQVNSSGEIRIINGSGSAATGGIFENFKFRVD